MKDCPTCKGKGEVDDDFGRTVIARHVELNNDLGEPFLRGDRAKNFKATSSGIKAAEAWKINKYDTSRGIKERRTPEGSPVLAILVNKKEE